MKNDKIDGESLKFKIKNVIATFEIDSPVNLDEVYNYFSESSLYDETIFYRGVVVFQNQDPKLTLLIYRTGKVICTGANSIQSAKNSDEFFKELAEEKGFEIDILERPSVNNVVEVANFESDLDLEGLVTELDPESTEYEPEQFPGLIYSLKKSDAKVLIFNSGKIVCVGAESEKDLEVASSELQKVLK